MTVESQPPPSYRAAHMSKDTDLDALRDRKDIKKRLAELAGKKEKKP
jgi:hypothetical protein